MILDATAGERERQSLEPLLATPAPRSAIVSGKIAAACVTAVAVPDGLTDVQVRAHCRERYGVMISAGQGAGNLVRIGHMGLSARGLHPVVGLAALGRTLADLGASVDIGAGVETALAELSQAMPEEEVAAAAVVALSRNT